MYYVYLRKRAAFGFPINEKRFLMGKKKKSNAQAMSFSAEDYIEKQEEEKEEQKQEKKSDPKPGKLMSAAAAFLRMLPAIIFSSFVILVVRTYVYSRPMSQFFWSDGTDKSEIYDIFNYWKAVVVIFCAALAVAVFLVSDRKKSIVKGRPLYIAMGIYAAGAVLSFAFCDYKNFSLIGFNERFEGRLPILSYVIMLFFIMNMVREERDIKILLVPLAVSMLLMSWIGLTQAAGKDFFATLAGQKIITPYVKYPDGSSSWIRLAQLMISGKSAYTFKFAPGEVYQTVYNLNYVPFYLSAILPLFAMLFIKCFTGEKSPKKAGVGVVSLIVYGLCLYNFFCANSASGYFGLALIVILGLIFFRKKLKEWLKPLAAIVLVTALVMGILSDRWLPEVKSLLADAGESISFSLSAFAADEAPKTMEFKNDPASKKPQIDRIITGENYVTMTLFGNDLKAVVDETGLVFYDSDDEPVGVRLIDDGRNYFMFNDERFHDYVKFGYDIQDDQLIFIFVTAGTPWRFHFVNGEGFRYVTPTSTDELPRETAIGPIESIGFENNPRFGTNRGYIWSRTFPMLKSRIFLGSGPDTYCIYFPQNDYAAKYTIQGNTAIITDKPHNMYLLNAVNNGCIAALAYIAMIAFVLIDAAKHCCKMKGYAPLAEFIGSGAFLGVAAFAVVGLFNDTCPSTAPLFYTMMGLAAACARIAENAEKNAPKAEASETAAGASEA